jgi:hypothetical protein
MSNLIWSHLGYRDTIETGFLVICLILFWFVPRFMNRVFAAFETAGARFASNKRAALLVITSAVLVIRLCILSLVPVPFPKVHDEFSYLLAGDTFAHGRLTNPPHPMWLFFDTIHVNQHPSYMSKYPPAQGAVLALGEMLGHPWIGVLLSCAAMCAAMVWALQGWLPSRWAFLGALIFTLHVGIFSYWMNSYWGGAVAVTGGALVTGAFSRITRTWRFRDALLLGLGAVTLANSRPFEGLIFCIPVTLGLFFALCKRWRGIWRRALPQVIAPLCVIAALCGAFMAYYNWRGTGNWLLSPYVLNDRNYLGLPAFIWQAPRPPLQHTSPQLDNFYNGWVRDFWFQGRINSFRTLGGTTVHDVARVAYFFLWPELCFLVPVLVVVWHDKKYRTLFIQLVICLCGFILVHWFYPHYAAPLTPVLFVLLTQAIRHVRYWEHRSRPIGVGFSRAIVFSVLALAPFHDRHYPIVPSGMDRRARLSAQLNSIPGEHLVIVHYSKEHDPSAEWVYNAADIDHAKIVWAREIPGVDLHPLLNYFGFRRVWLVNPDVPTLDLSSYSERALPVNEFCENSPGSVSTNAR